MKKGTESAHEELEPEEVASELGRLQVVLELFAVFDPQDLDERFELAFLVRYYPLVLTLVLPRVEFGT